MGKECGDNHATVAICRSLKDRKQGCCHASVASNRCHARPISSPCPSSARSFSSAPSEYTEVTEVLDRIRDVTSPKIAKKVDAIFVFNVEGEGKFHVDLKIGNEVSVGVGEPAGKADVTATLSKEVFLQIFNRKLKPANAFMSGQVKLSGDLSKMISLESVMKASRDH